MFVDTGGGLDVGDAEGECVLWSVWGCIRRNVLRDTAHERVYYGYRRFRSKGGMDIGRVRYTLLYTYDTSIRDHKSYGICL
jgi:hypothetical protein